MNHATRFLKRQVLRTLAAAVLLAVTVIGSPLLGAETQRPAWKVGSPIVTYWAGPPMTDKVAQQMADGGWNLVWCAENELDVAERHHLRAQLQDGLLSPQVLDHPAERAKLDALVARVSRHPALYSYFLRDEPNAADFLALGGWSPICASTIRPTWRTSTSSRRTRITSSSARKGTPLRPTGSTCASSSTR